MKKDLTTKTFKYFHMNSRKNISSSGFASLPMVESEHFEDFTSLEDGDDYFLVSRFGVYGFVCSGSCYCDSNRRSLSSSSVISRSLIYLVASASSLLAMNQAKEYFQKECETRISEECSLSREKYVHSEVEECLNVESMFDFELEEDDDVEIQQEILSEYHKERLDEIGKHVYKCYGKCFPNVALKKPEAIHFRDHSGYDCTKLEVTGFVAPDMNELRGSDKFKEQVKSTDLNFKPVERFEKDEREEARLTFYSRILDNYCRKISEKKLMDLKKSQGLEEISDKVKKSPVRYSICTGTTSTTGRTTNIVENPTIECVKSHEFDNEDINAFDFMLKKEKYIKHVDNN